MADIVKRGLKRKHDGHQKPEDTASKIHAKLLHGVKDVTKASKKVKAFEIQKVVKKLKDATKGEDESNIKGLELQLDCLKHIDHENVAVRSLRSKIKKHVPLSRNEDVREAISSELSLTSSNNNPSAESDPVRIVVESRLLSSKILAEEVNDVIQALEAILGTSKPEMRTSDGHVNMDSEKEEEDERDEEENLGQNLSGESASRGEDGDSGNESGDDASWTGFDDSNALEENEEVERWGSRDSDNQPSESEVFSSASPPPRMKKSRPLAADEKKGKTGESTFLPSLTVGFISGSSDSEWDDAEANVVDIPVKKNRRGQRARKAIWEKKYGRNANHLKKQREVDVNDTIRTAYAHRGGRGQSTPRGSVVRGHGRGRVPVRGTDIGSGTSLLRQTHNGHDAARRGARDPIAKPPTNVHPPRNRKVGAGDDSKPLHPSWEAKRKLKDKESPAILPSMGTKLKFT